MLKSTLYTILEVNSSNLNLMVVEKSVDYTHFIYNKQTPYDGFENRRFNNAEELFVLIQHAFTECEESTNIILNDFYVVLPQRFFRTSMQEKSKLLNGKAVEDKDIKKALNKFFVADSGFKPVNLLPITYKIDGNEYKNPPLGNLGKAFSVIIEQLALESSVEELFSTCAKRLGKTVNFVATTSLALHKYSINKIMQKSIFVAINESSTDISLCEDSQVIENLTVEWGGDYVFMALMDLLDINKNNAKMLTSKINFNLPIADNGTYVLSDGSRNSFEISKVNKHVITTLYYIIKDINKSIYTLNRGTKLPVYFFGNEICDIRGIKDIIESFTETETIIIKSKKINEESISYTLDALLDNNFDYEMNKKRTLSDLLKIKFN